MYLCRCPHCQATFQLSIPHDSEYWDRAPVDDDGLIEWVCLDCHRRGHRIEEAEQARPAGHDTSWRHDR
jgi:phage terminase large subunit GpA-like protein